MKKTITLFLCLLFTVAPFHVSAMQQEQEINDLQVRDLLARLIPENFETYTHPLEAMMIHEKAFENLELRSKVINETKCNIYQLFMSVHKSVWMEYLKTSEIQPTMRKLVAICKPLIQLHLELSREKNVNDFFCIMLQITERCIKIRNYLERNT